MEYYSALNYDAIGVALQEYPYDPHIDKFLQEFINNLLGSDLTFEKSIEDRLFFFLDSPAVLVKIGKSYAISTGILGSAERLLLIIESKPKDEKGKEKEQAQEVEKGSEKGKPQIKKISPITFPFNAITPNFSPIFGSLLSAPSVYNSDDLQSWFHKCHPVSKPRYFSFQKLLPGSVPLITYLSSNIFNLDITLSLICQLTLSLIIAYEQKGYSPLSLGIENILVAPGAPHWIQYSDNLYFNNQGVHLSIIGDLDIVYSKPNIQYLVNLILQLASPVQTDDLKVVYRIGISSTVNQLVALLDKHFKINDYIKFEGRVSKDPKTKSPLKDLAIKDNYLATVYRGSQKVTNYDKLNNNIDTLHKLASGYAKVISDKKLIVMTRTSALYDFVNILRRLTLLQKIYYNLDSNASNKSSYISLTNLIGGNLSRKKLLKNAKLLYNPEVLEDFIDSVLDCSGIVDICPEDEDKQNIVIGAGRNKEYKFSPLDISITVDINKENNPDILADANSVIFSKCKSFDKAFVVYHEGIVYDKFLFANIARLLKKDGELYVPWPVPGKGDKAETKLYETIKLYIESLGFKYSGHDGKKWATWTL